MRCRSCRVDAHPCYGTFCEDCWVDMLIRLEYGGPVPENHFDNNTIKVSDAYNKHRRPVSEARNHRPVRQILPPGKRINDY